MTQNLPVTVRRLIEAWEHAQQRVETARRELSRAGCDLDNAIIALGKWMRPDDAEVGEVFCVWWGDNLIEVTVKGLSGNGSYDIRVRTRGKRSRIGG